MRRDTKAKSYEAGLSGFSSRSSVKKFSAGGPSLPSDRYGSYTSRPANLNQAAVSRGLSGLKSSAIGAASLLPGMAISRAAKVPSAVRTGVDVFSQFLGGMADALTNPPENQGEIQYRRGGKVSKGQAKVGKVMGEYKRGELHSGSKKGPVVKNPKQAIAIALSEARKAGAKIPKRAEGGEVYSDEYMAYGDKKGPYRGSPKKGKMLGRQDRRSRAAMERAEKSAPGLSIDMPDRKARGGMLVQRRKKAYSGNY